LTRNQALQLAGQPTLTTGGDVYHHEAVLPSIPVVQRALGPTNGHHPPVERREVFEAVPDDPFAQAVHRIADRLTPRFRNRLLASIEELRQAIDDEALTLAIQAGSAEAVVAAIPWDVWQRRFGDMAEQLLAEGAGQAGRAAAETLAGQLDLAFRFDVTNPRAIAWAQSHAARLITQIDESSQVAIRALVVQATKGGATVQDVSRQVRSLVGLHSRQVRAVANFEARLTRQGVSGDALARRVDRYAAAQLRSRAELIARFELLSATNMGQQMAWEKAETEGLIDPFETRKLLIVTDDERLCEICEALDGFQVPLHDRFPGGAMQPPLHGRCRCTTGLVFVRQQETVHA
jgi:SPP1 gp7 family putative phage head morphogenesis protein